MNNHRKGHFNLTSDKCFVTFLISNGNLSFAIIAKKGF